MTSDVEQIKQKLLDERAKLRELTEATKEASAAVELDQTRVGRLSRMDAMQAQQMALEASRRRQLQLQKIDSALRRIEAGEYGYCFACGEEIDPRRLSIDPTSTRCVECVEQ